MPYESASHTSRDFKRWQAYPRAASSDYDHGTQQTLAGRCRDAVGNQPIAKAAIDRLKHNVTGSGLRLQPSLNADILGISELEAITLEKRIAFLFEKWSQNCEWENHLDFNGLQTLAFVSMMVSGDSFAYCFFDKHLGPMIQIIEQEQVSNPSWVYDSRNLKNGVELQNGRPVAFWVMTEHPGEDTVSEYRWVYTPIFCNYTGLRNICHLFDKERPGQFRGVPLLTTVLGMLKKLDKYSDAELSAAVASSLITLFVKNTQDSVFPGNTDSTTAPNKSDEFALGSGAVISLAGNEEIDPFNPTRPNSNYEPFIVALLKQIAASLGLPYEFLMLNFQSSYSASRAAMAESWKVIEFYRNIVVRQFCVPAYERFLYWSVYRGDLELPGFFSDPLKRYAYGQANWVGLPKPVIDEEKEVGAAEKRVSLGISNRQIEGRQLLGHDWESVNRQLIKEESERKKGGIGIDSDPGT